MLIIYLPIFKIASRTVLYLISQFLLHLPLLFRTMFSFYFLHCQFLNYTCTILLDLIIGLRKINPCKMEHLRHFTGSDGVGERDLVILLRKITRCTSLSDFAILMTPFIFMNASIGNWIKTNKYYINFSFLFVLCKFST